ncbi:MAG: hypothetical protein Q8K62_01255 [Thiobacillus sp.]|nr:hypothetical protein [Thiobacillus sp.]
MLQTFQYYLQDTNKKITVAAFFHKHMKWHAPGFKLILSIEFNQAGNTAHTSGSRGRLFPQRVLPARGHHRRNQRSPKQEPEDALGKDVVYRALTSEMPQT